MNHLKFRTVLITALALGVAQASFAAAGCGPRNEPPCGRNGWQPATTTKALPQTAAVQAASTGAQNELSGDRNHMQPAAAKVLPTSATAKARLRTVGDR